MRLGFHVVGDEVGGGVGGHFACRPVGVVGQVGRQQGYTQLTLNGHQCAINRMSMHCFPKSVVKAPSLVPPPPPPPRGRPTGRPRPQREKIDL